MTSSEAGMFLPDLLKTFKFHFTVGTLPVVRVSQHLQHVFLMQSFYSHVRTHSKIQFVFSSATAALAGKMKGVSTGGVQDFGLNTGCAWPWSRRDTFSLSCFCSLCMAAHCRLQQGGSCWFRFPFRCVILQHDSSLPCDFFFLPLFGLK